MPCKDAIDVTEDFRRILKYLSTAVNDVYSIYKLAENLKICKHIARDFQQSFFFFVNYYKVVEKN